MLHKFLVISEFVAFLDSENDCIAEVYVSIVITNALIEPPSSKSLLMTKNWT